MYNYTELKIDLMTFFYYNVQGSLAYRWRDINLNHVPTWLNYKTP